MKLDKFAMIIIGLDVVAWLIAFILIPAPLPYNIIMANFAAICVNLTLTGLNLAGITDKLETMIKQHSR